MTLKTFAHLYQKTISTESLFQAWEEFKQGKRKKHDVGLFERHLEDNLFALHSDLINKCYRHGNYSGFYITDPKVRHIHKARVRDRIVHHALFTILNPIFEPTFIDDSYSCRKRYGTHRGFRKLVLYSRKASKNYIKTCWVLKCDIKKFFDNVDHDILLRIIKKRIKDLELFWLITEIVESYETLPGKGIPIGNLTSQLFANIYLNELDQFIKHKIRINYYLRYTDDFLILSRDRSYLLQCYITLKHFLWESLKLELHPGKVTLRKLDWGIDFLGYIALPYYSLPRTKTKRRIFRKIKEKMNQANFNQVFQSYLGYFSHANTFGLVKHLKNQVWFWQGQV